MSEACPECVEHLAANFSARIHAAAEAGPENGMTTTEALEAFYRHFHRTGHKEPADG